MPGLDLRAVAKTALSFRKARHWEQFHTPSNLAKGLVIEAAELLENFLWARTAGEEAAALAERRAAIEDEVADVAVFGIPDDEMGEKVLAVVEPVDRIDAGAGDDARDALAAELEAHCRAHLAGYKCPRRWEFTDALPRNAMGKLQKNLLS